MNFTQCECGRMVQMNDGEQVSRVLEGALKQAGDAMCLYIPETCPTCNSRAVDPVDPETCWFITFLEQCIDRWSTRGIFN
jgi:hypothetical protein